MHSKLTTIFLGDTVFVRSHSMMTAAEKLALIRSRMVDVDVDALIVCSGDAHNSEYTADCDERRKFLSGFSGSSGTAIVTLHEALLWTDGRYTVQAQEELANTEWQLMQQSLPDTPTVSKWLGKASVTRVGFDPSTTTVSFYKQLLKELPQPDDDASPPERGDDRKWLVPLEANLVDAVGEHWDPPRPPRALEPITLHPVSFAGTSVSQKLVKLRESLKTEKCYAVVLSALDDIAWLFNLRGSDVSFNPVFLSYAMVTEHDAILFVDDFRLEEPAREKLSEADVRIRPYDALPEALKDLPLHANHRVMMDLAANCRIYHVVPAKKVYLHDNPVKLMKAVKNETEIAGMVAAHTRDAIAMIRFLASLQRGERDGSVYSETEVTLADRLDGYRSELDQFVGLSFPTISAAGPNSAMPHYRATAATCRTIEEDSYLFDSGAQFHDGTTDVTRCVRFGEPTDVERTMYTLVLKGHLELGRAWFPKGTRGPQLDAFARRPLWERGLDFKHGTGHGVGSYLNVHEGPCGITPALAGSPSETALSPGMVISNEPGFYYDGHFGFRVENLLLVVLAEAPNASLYMGDSCPPSYRFDDLTLVPHERRLIDVSLLTDEHLKAVNDYHARVWDTMHGLVDEEAKVYLRDATAEIFR
eukprot:Polyplicarium_translucidae@DN1994_c0_g1_i3.p1